MCLFNGCYICPIYKSMDSSWQWTAYTRLLLLSLNVQPLGWTSFCLSVLLGLKNGLLKILLRFLDTPDIHGMIILFHKCDFNFWSKFSSEKAPLMKSEKPSWPRFNPPLITMTQMTESLHRHLQACLDKHPENGPGV